MKTDHASPLSSADRILSLDVLRGFAVLGILIMNIQSFSMIEAAYINPTAYGDLAGVNKWVWILSHILADSKFMTLFSMLFGAGIVLFTTRLESKGLNPATYHYRRAFWLLVFGLIHAYAFWYGDILVNYAVCAMILFFLRRLSARKLCIIGIICISVPSLLYLFFGWTMSYWPPEALENIMATWKPGETLINQEVAAYQGSWIAQMSHRIPAARFMQTFIFLIHLGWRAAGMMLAGMALYKWKVLTAERSKTFYILMAFIGLIAGYALVAAGVIINFRNQWSSEYSMFWGMQFNYWGSIAVALGYIGVIMLIVKSAAKFWLFTAFARTGQAAFTNYLAQTLICTLLFYGHGLGLFGRLERIEQVLVVTGIWIVELMLSSWWFTRFRYGPAEWIWRKLTYFRIQPFRRNSL